MPCRNADNAVAALREFEQNTRPAVFENILKNNSSSATYTITIMDRLKTKKRTKPKRNTQDLLQTVQTSISSPTLQGGAQRLDMPSWRSAEPKQELPASNP